MLLPKNKQAVFVIVLIFLGVSSGAWANVVRVKANATGSKNGTSWADAFTDLQAAFAVAQWGDELWVATGTYKPTAGTDRTKSFVMTAGVAIYGGFLGGETSRSQRNWTTNATILSGDIGTLGDASDNSYHVVAGGYNAVIDGFTITGGNSDSGDGGGMVNDSASSTIMNCVFINNKSVRGAGMYISAISPTIVNCSFISNSAGFHSGSSVYSGFGAGMYVNGGSPTLSNCSFTNNSATYGGGLYSDKGSLILTDCIFDGNSAASWGGGINNDGASVTTARCVFKNNSARYGGGMNNSGSMNNMTNCIFNNNSAESGGGMKSNTTSTLINCVFNSNSASELGGGIYGRVTLMNSTFSKNSANGNGGGIYIPTVSYITNSIFWNNTATLGPEIYNGGSNIPIFRHCDIRGCGGSGTSWNAALGVDGGGNIMADPLFVTDPNPAGTDGIWRTADDGSRLQTGSPCINAGLVSGAPATDILGNSRVGAPDIGAYEFLSNPIPNPPSMPEGRLALTYTITKTSTAPAGKTVQYTYKWTSDKSGSVTHGPTTALSDTLTEMDLVHAGDTWTVTVTPSYETTMGTPASAKVKILSDQNGVNQWALYK